MEKEKEKTFSSKKLLSVKDMCEYMSISQSTARRMLSDVRCPYVIRVRGRIYANKDILDKWIDANTGR